MSSDSLICLSYPPQTCGTGLPYSKIVPNSEKDGKGATRRCGLPSSSTGPNLALLGCYTSYETFRRGVEMNPNGPCMGHRHVDSKGTPTPYVFESYREVEERIDKLAAALEVKSIIVPNPENMRLLGLYSQNRTEWIIGEQAAFCHSCITVPLYETLDLSTLEFILQQTNMSAVMCGGKKELDKLKEVFLRRKCPFLKTVICMDHIEEKEVIEAGYNGLRVLQMSELESYGEHYLNKLHHSPPKGTDICTFCYTSGTTGDPKGALLTHQNLISSAAAALSAGVFDCTEKNSYISYLPLPHIYERVMQIGIFAGGAPVGFFRGNPLELMSDVAALRPEIMPAVPRVLNRIYDKVTNGMLAAGGLKSKLFVRACRAKVEGLKQGSLSHSLWDKLIFNKIKGALGMDKVRLMVTGSAPISSNVLTFMRILLGCNVIEGYGQTETSAGVTLTQLGDFSADHVGGPMPCSEICLKDVPEMGYFHTDSWHGGDPRSGGGGGVPCEGRGEICFRGTNVFVGYFKDAEQTRAAFDEDGWLHSGDIGLWTTNGTLRIFDRKKNIFKLSQGEYVAPEKIENALILSPLIAQSFVYGDPLKSYLVAVIVPDLEAVKIWGDAKGLGVGALASRDLRDRLSEEIVSVGSRKGLQRFEMVRDFFIEKEPFTAENGILTPTMKLKRGQAMEKYGDVLKGLYDQKQAGNSKL